MPDFMEKGGISLPTGQIVYLDPNNPDTDGEEISLKIQIVDWDSAHNPIYGLTGYIFRSNPLSTDSDRDGYFDEVDPHPFTVDAMYINDRALNDDDFHNGSAITEKTSGAYTDGKFVADQDNGTAKYVFNRNSNRDHYFTLTPEKESFYKFTGASYLEITYEKGLIFKSTVTVKPETDGTYLLNKGATYTIKMRTSSGEFSVQQDNWVYAPDGGIWSIGGNISNPLAAIQPMVARAFISPKLLVESTCKVLPDSNNYKVYTCYTKSDVDAIIANLTYTDPSAEAGFLESIDKMAAEGGFLIMLVSLIPGVKEVSLVSHILLYGGGISSGIGTISWMSDVIEKYENESIKEVIQKGNLSITSSHFAGGSMRNVWDVWETPGYINKYQAGNRGKVNKYVNADDIKNFCGW